MMDCSGSDVTNDEALEELSQSDFGNKGCKASLPNWAREAAHTKGNTEQESQAP